jgi:hypothetical protein
LGVKLRYLVCVLLNEREVVDWSCCDSVWGLHSFSRSYNHVSYFSGEPFGLLLQNKIHIYIAAWRSCNLTFLHFTISIIRNFFDSVIYLKFLLCIFQRKSNYSYFYFKRMYIYTPSHKCIGGTLLIQSLYLHTYVHI